MKFCEICSEKVVYGKCRRCSRLICVDCFTYHGLCRKCVEIIRPKKLI